MNKPVILLIEDDLLLSDAFAEILRMETSYDVEVIHDGQDAIDRLRSPAATVVLLDLHLPKVSGLEILARLRADERWRQTRVVVMTADSMGAQEAQKQADRVMIKPVDFDDVLSFVSKIEGNAGL